MPTIIDIHEAETQLSHLLDRVRTGEEFILTKAGMPCAQLVPFEPRSKRRPGLVEGRITDAFFDPLPDEELELWEK